MPLLGRPANTTSAASTIPPPSSSAPRTSELDGSFPRVLKHLHSTDLLVIDNFGIEKATPAAYRLFLQVFQERERCSTLVTSQYTPDNWRQIIKDQTVAGAIADRLAFTSYRITLEGESLRRKRSESGQ